MPEVTYLAPAKINLFLHITSKRADGYHNLQTIFQLLDYSDEITFNLRNDDEINRIYGNETIPPDTRLNFTQRTYLKKILLKLKSGVDIGVVKKIPTGGGLGGGSSNAATVLIALNDLWNLQTTQKQASRYRSNLGCRCPIICQWLQCMG